MPRYNLRSLFMLTLLLGLAMSMPHWAPRSQSITRDKSAIGYYTGLGISDGSGYFGKNWYRLVYHESQDDSDRLNGRWVIDISRSDYSSFRGYYATGVLREEGQCMVVLDGTGPQPDWLDIQRAKFYDPNGELVSEIKNGNGQLVRFFSNGGRHLHIDFADGEIVYAKRWYRNGQLYGECEWRHGRPHGALASYFTDGQLMTQGKFSVGKPTGIWKRYTENGKVESETDHGE